MPNINFYYLAQETISNLKMIFNSSDVPFVRLSKFLDLDSVGYNSELVEDEKIGYFKRKKGPAVLEDFWKSAEFIEFLQDATGLNPKLSEANHLSYSAGDYSLLHMEESEPKRLVVVYDFTKKWRLEWGGNDIFFSPEKEHLICNRDYGSLMIVKLEKGDISCTRYVSLKSQDSAKIDFATYDID